MTDAEAVLAVFEPKLDRATATIIATDDPRKRHFIAETLLTAAALYLLKKYCDGYLDGLGFTNLAKTQGEQTRNFLAKIRTGSISKEELSIETASLDSILREIRLHPAKAAQAKADSQASVEKELVESGATTQQARKTAEAVTSAVFSKIGT